MPMRKIFLLLWLLSCVCCVMLPAQNSSLIPIPVSQQTGNGNFVITASTVITVPSNQPQVQKIATYFVERIKPSTGFVLKISETPASNAIQLLLNTTNNTQLGQEGYLLDVEANKIFVTAKARFS